MSGVSSIPTQSPSSQIQANSTSSSSSSSSSSPLGLAAVGTSMISPTFSTSSFLPPSAKKARSFYCLSQSNIVNKYEIKIDRALSPYFEQLEIDSEDELSFAQQCFVIRTALLATQHAFQKNGKDVNPRNVRDLTGLYKDLQILDKFKAAFTASGRLGSCCYHPN